MEPCRSLIPEESKELCPRRALHLKIKIMKKTEEIELLGKKLLISERSIRDIIDASNYSKENPEAEKKLFLNSFVVASGLKINLERLEDPKNIPYFRFIKKYKARLRYREMEKLVSVNNLMNKLSLNETNEISEKILTLDFGANNSEKKKEDL